MPNPGDTKECGGRPSGTGMSETCTKCGSFWYFPHSGDRCKKTLEYRENNHVLSPQSGTGWYQYKGTGDGWVKIE